MASSRCGRTWYRGILPVGPTSLTSGEQKPPRPLISSTSLPHSHSLPPNIIHIIHIFHIVHIIIIQTCRHNHHRFTLKSSPPHCWTALRPFVYCEPVDEEAIALKACGSKVFKFLEGQNVQNDTCRETSRCKCQYLGNL